MSACVRVRESVRLGHTIVCDLWSCFGSFLGLGAWGLGPSGLPLLRDRAGQASGGSVGHAWAEWGWYLVGKRNTELHLRPTRRAQLRSGHAALPSRRQRCDHPEHNRRLLQVSAWVVLNSARAVLGEY